MTGDHQNRRIDNMHRRHDWMRLGNGRGGEKEDETVGIC